MGSTLRGIHLADGNDYYTSLSFFSSFTTLLGVPHVQGRLGLFICANFLSWLHRCAYVMEMVKSIHIWNFIVLSDEREAAQGSFLDCSNI